MKAFLILLTSCAGLPLLSKAQTTRSSPRFYVGVGAFALTDRGFRSTTYDYDPIKPGPCLTFGTWLRPRLAVQVSGAVAWNHDTYSFTYYDYSTPPFPIPTATSNIDRRQTLYTLPVLLRYSLTPPTAKFHLDALGGITLLHAAYQYVQTTVPTSSPYDGSSSSSRTTVNVTFGPALRYALTPSLQLTADPLVNIALANQQYTAFRSRLFWNFQAGVHYSFGQL